VSGGIMHNKERIKALFTLLPSIILIGVFVYGFIGNTFWISLTDWGSVGALAEHPVRNYAGFSNYIDLFTGFLLFSGFLFLFHKKKHHDNYREDKPYFKLTLVGSVAGLLSGLLGIGGGNIISPLMLMLGFNPKKITAITAFVVPFSSFSGFLTYWTMGSINWKILIIASIAGVAGAMLGTAFMQKKLNAETVKKILAIILLFMAAKLMFNLF